MEIFASLTEKTKLGKRTQTSGSKLPSGQNIFVLKPLHEMSGPETASVLLQKRSIVTFWVQVT